MTSRIVFREGHFGQLLHGRQTGCNNGRRLYCRAAAQRHADSFSGPSSLGRIQADSRQAGFQVRKATASGGGGEKPYPERRRNMLGPIGITEMVIIVVIALLVFGPKKLPSLGKSLAEGIVSFKKGISGGDNQSAAVEKSKEGSDKS